MGGMGWMGGTGWMGRIGKILPLLPFLAFLPVQAARAQSTNTSTIVVLVTDPSGAVIKDAKVSVINSETGAVRDVLQNHLLQVLALVAMEPPVSLEAESIRDEKVKLLKSIRPLHPTQVPSHVVRGQYTVGEIAGEPRLG